MKEFRCKVCGLAFQNLAGLRGHERLTHSTVGLRLSGDEINARFAALEKANQGLENSIIELIKRTSKHFLALANEINAEAKASFERDKGLLEELKLDSRDSTKNIENLLEITHGIQENQGAMLKILTDLAHLKLKLEKVKKEEAQV